MLPFLFVEEFFLFFLSLHMPWLQLLLAASRPPRCLSACLCSLLFLWKGLLSVFVSWRAGLKVPFPTLQFGFSFSLSLSVTRVSGAVEGATATSLLSGKHSPPLSLLSFFLSLLPRLSLVFLLLCKDTRSFFSVSRNTYTCTWCMWGVSMSSSCTPLSLSALERVGWRVVWGLSE